MKASAPELTPLFRSDAQGRMLALLFGNPAQEFTVTEIAEHTGLSLPTVTRELTRFTRPEYLVERRVGRNRLVRANERHELYEPLRQIVLYGYGPAVLIPDALRSVDGVDAAYIFGSWAARYHGERGSDPRDIDLLVIGDPARESVFQSVASVERELRRSVNITFLSPERWLSGDDGFVRTVRERPLVELL
jgi:DNA-binding transcriptional ArsR family regulator